MSFYCYKQKKVVDIIETRTQDLFPAMEVLSP